MSFSFAAFSPLYARGVHLPDAPDINRRAIISRGGAQRDHLRCEEARAAAEVGELLAAQEGGGQPEVAHLDVEDAVVQVAGRGLGHGVEQDVLRLEVAVADAHGVAVVDRVDDRAGDALTVRLAQALGVLIRVVEQVLTALGMDNRTTLLRPRLD